MSRATQRRRAFERRFQDGKYYSPETISTRSDEINAEIVFLSKINLPKDAIKKRQKKISRKQNHMAITSFCKKSTDVKPKPSLKNIIGRKSKNINTQDKVSKSIRNFVNKKTRKREYIFIGYNTNISWFLIEFSLLNTEKIAKECRLPHIPASGWRFNSDGVYERTPLHKAVELHKEILELINSEDLTSYAIIFANGKYMFDNERKISYFEAN